AMNNLANSYADAGRRDDALKLREQVLELRRKVLGPEHPDTLDTMAQLAWLLCEQRKYAEVERLISEALPKGAAGQATNVGVLRLRGEFRARRGQWQEAAADLAEIIRRQPTAYEPYHSLAAVLL